MMPFLQDSPLTAFIVQNNIQFIGPELVLTIFILVGVWHLAFSKTREERQATWSFATVGVVMTLVCLAAYWWTGYYDNPKYFGSLSVLNGMFKADMFSLLVRTLLASGTLLMLFFTKTFIDKHADVPGEFYIILMGALLGGMMLSGATDLIMVFAALETLSISSYILAAYLRGNQLSAEAGLKYLLYGGMATAIFLFGLSILYGLVGSTSFADIAVRLPLYADINPLVWAIMAIMIVGGICFKLSAAPFHMWAPDTYEGAPTPVVAFLSVVSKIAAFSLAIRLFSITFGVHAGWAELVSVLSVVSMVVGNVVALTQRNIKRLLAYSTVAHVGYLLLGLVVMTQIGLASVLYYLMAYLFMNLGAFAVVTYLEDVTGHTDIASYAGLARKRPGLALVLSIMFLSLAGIPITAGFFGKFFLFQAVVNAGPQYLWLVIVALLTSTISLYYYLNVIRLMVIAEPSDAVNALPEQTVSATMWSSSRFAMALCLIATLGLGLLAQQFLDLSNRAVHQLSRPDAYALHAPTLHQPQSLLARHP
jgi:NAD(P)H-quinone oxidoreductase subunit 2